jgi:hypothetical protein
MKSKNKSETPARRQKVNKARQRGNKTTKGDKKVTDLLITVLASRPEHPFRHMLYAVHNRLEIPVRISTSIQRPVLLFRSQTNGYLSLCRTLSDEYSLSS